MSLHRPFHESDDRGNLRFASSVIESAFMLLSSNFTYFMRMISRCFPGISTTHDRAETAHAWTKTRDFQPPSSLQQIPKLGSS